MDANTASRTRSPARPRPPVAGWIAAAAAVIGLIGCQAGATPTHDQTPAGRGEDTTAHDGIVDEADGVLPEGVAVHDDSYPGVAQLAPELLDALRAATVDARTDGVSMHVTSGWRSAEYQERLLDDAVVEYGSVQEAARWVATADTSAHVSGDAVDIGPYDAISWLAQHGSSYGLCQIYGNEAWHYELRPDAVTDGCPLMYTDPTQDPRLQH